MNVIPSASQACSTCSDAIGGSAFLMWIPAAAVTAVFWSTISPRARARAAAEDAEVAAASAESDRKVDQAAHEARAEPLGLRARRRHRRSPVPASGCRRSHRWS